jgi:hypothetical protein
LAVWVEDLSSPFYLAVLPLPREAGDLLQESEIALTEIAVEAGEHVDIQGGYRKGFTFSRIPEEDPTLVEDSELEAGNQEMQVTKGKPPKKPARPKSKSKKQAAKRSPRRLSLSSKEKESRQP